MVELTTANTATQLNDIVSNLPLIQRYLEAQAELQVAQKMVQEAEERIQAILGTIPYQIEDGGLKQLIVRWLYWFNPDLPVKWIADALEIKHVGSVSQMAGLLQDAICCESCGVSLGATSRSALQLYLTKDKRRSYVPDFLCEKCREKREQQTSAHWQAIEDARIARQRELENMPYADYLQTPEWQSRRQQHLKSTGYRCQVCNTNKKQLHVHHRTYERRGHENFKDLIVLCKDCHRLFHEQGKLTDYE